jgi:hypothetical protein
MADHANRYSSERVVSGSLGAGLAKLPRPVLKLYDRSRKGREGDRGRTSQAGPTSEHGRSARLLLPSPAELYTSCSSGSGVTHTTTG